MSTILCIDTASDRFALSVERDGAFDSFESAEEREHTTSLLPEIGRLLKADSLAAILVITGPGAYAGLRVGIATAEGLSLARAVPVFGVGTLEAVALAAGPGASYTAIHPAGRGDFAAQSVDAGQLEGPIRSVPSAELTGAVAGEGAGAFGGDEISPRERCLAALRDRAPRIRAGELSPGAEAFYLREPSITVSRRRNAP